MPHRPNLSDLVGKIQYVVPIGWRLIAMPRRLVAVSRRLIDRWRLVSMPCHAGDCALSRVGSRVPTGV